MAFESALRCPALACRPSPPQQGGLGVVAEGDEKPTIWLFERRTPGAIAKGRVRQARGGQRRAPCQQPQRGRFRGSPSERRNQNDTSERLFVVQYVPVRE